MSGRRALFIIASVAVSVMSLALILRTIPIGSVLDSLRGADPLYLLLSVAAVALSLLTRGIRWWILLNRRISVVDAFHMINVMFLGNQLPFRLGEVARSLLAARRGVPLVTAGASIVVERLIDVLALTLVIAATVSRMPSAPTELTDTAALLGPLALFGFLLLLVFAHAPAAANRLLDRLLKALPLLNRLPLRSMLGHLLDGLQPLTNSRTLVLTIVWSALAWAAALLALHILHLALGIEVDFTISVPLGIALTAISIALPVSIAAVGPFELAILVTGQLVGMSELEAISLGFLLHGINVVSYAVWGTIGLLALGASPAMAFGAKPKSAEDDA